MIICLGTTPAVQRSLTFDRLQLDEVNRTTAVHVYASGKAINAARVLHTLGQEVLCTGFLGGEGGTLIRRDLDDVGIAHRFLEVAAPTRTCATLIDRAGGTATELVEESTAVEPGEYDRLLASLKEILEQRRDAVAGLMLCGSLPPEGPGDFYARSVALGRQAGLITLVDAKGPQLMAALAERPSVVKPNRSELSETVGRSFGSNAELESAVQQLLARGPAAAVVTGGKGPTLVSDDTSRWKIATPAVPVVSPIGSGDSFAAGLMAALVEGKPIDQAACLAVACGSANAMTPYAGHLDRGVVGRLLNAIRAEPFGSL